MDKPPVAYTESRHIPNAIQRYVEWRDKGECVTPDCKCREGLQMDHCPPWHTMPKGKRFHDPDKIFLRCEAHHKEKSKQDTTDYAKYGRLGRSHRGERPQKYVRKIMSPGFDKTKTKKFSGAVVPRD